MAQEQTPLSRKVTRAWIGGPAVDGVPSGETSEVIGVVGSELLRLNEATAPTCVGCGRALPLVARCCVCGGLMCGGDSCGAVLCANERHRSACCPGCRERISQDNDPPQYLCQPHADELLLHRALVGLFLAAAVAVVLFHVWPG